MRFLDERCDWSDVRPPEDARASAVDSRRRIRAATLAFLVVCAMVFARLIALEIHQGASFRAEATKPQERRLHPHGVRGRIVSSDGVELAVDRTSQALAVEYRRLQQPLDAAWLRRMARATLPRAERRDAARLAQAEARVRVELADLHRRLATLCQLSPAEWDRRRTRVEQQVSLISQRVNQRRAERDALRAEAARQRAEQQANDETSWLARATAWTTDLLMPDDDTGKSAPIVVAEELDYHVLVDNLSTEVVAEIEAHPERYAGVRITERMRRDYPRKSLAAHLVGHLSVVSQDEIAEAARSQMPHDYHAKDRVGRLGLELHYETLLRGSHGTAVEFLDHAGHLISKSTEREPKAGRDLVLTVDAALQETAERLLDGALARRPRELGAVEPSRANGGGGAILALDIETGAVLAAASAPRFDPNLFTAGAAHEVELLLADAAHPLFDRATKMALAPGSTFEIATAITLLAEPDFDADESFECQGYWREPERQRCAIYVRDQVGHGPVTLADALQRDCNVYFFHHAAELGPPRLIDCALRLGFGRATGIDLASEASGFLPTPANIRDVEAHGWRLGDTQALAVGQGSLTVTPLQMARLMAAIANGGRLVTPFVVQELRPTTSETSGQHAEESHALLAQFQPERDVTRVVPGLDPQVLVKLREALQNPHTNPQPAVANDELEAPVTIAGKAGTAETSGARESHAWYAAYAPANAPRVAFVIVLEHAGDAKLSAYPVATRLAERMRQLGYFDGVSAPRRAQVAKARDPRSAVE